MPDGKTSDALLVFTPSGRRGRFPVGTPILTAARSLGVDIDSVCGGRGICGRCQVVLSEGEFAKHGLTSRAGHLSPWSAVEERYRSKRGMKAGRRLSCTATLQGDAVIDVPADSQVHKQVVRKRAEVRAIEMNPATRLHYLEVEEPDMHKPQGDLERVQAALAAQWGIEGAAADLDVIRVLQAALRKGGFRITVAVHEDRAGPRIVAVWPDFRDRIYGLAIDVGSTTIAAHLCDLASGEVVASAGVMNPQIRFGEDLMSRVSYVLMNPGGDREMTAAVREAISDLAAEVAAEAGIAPGDILEAVFVGNPIMHHLLLGIDPSELGGAPFALAAGTAQSLRASELDLKLHPGARVYVLPCIAGHVGADTAAVALSETPYLSDEIALIVDVGTNAEILLGNRHRLLAASSPTGPAFEGAQISCGQRAAPGAIERVRIDRETLEPRFKVIGCDLWSNEPGFAQAVAGIGVTGICGSGIIEALAEMYLSGLIRADGIVDGTKGARTHRIAGEGRTFSYLLHDGDPAVRITQGDVRAIQLAKGALYAGARLLMDHLGIDRVERVTLAGAFGSHIDPVYAMVLGLIPDCDPAKVGSAGNAAGTGARIALLNTAARAEIEDVVRRIEKIETAVEPKFQEHFVGAMAIPHATAPYTELAKAVDLPPREVTAAAEAGEGGRSRRRRRGTPAA
ncbi:ASKHA domain-containing protein [Futiania mangrovi]|uniref:ASKHA domain-containing protein n=1 Tax=Futiania mangrovi TaxID=2959716 RepID=A0A9J6PIL3_9PROT|nr:ASKHA domain-containing protein [Futiania mangrovii]MCP1335922.1 ASKHA domain-containing protein [Futiania mangrovii]